ncbi:hypothetical protein ANO11243_071950 [Dothideomycetidae sp. 11243]|nr:hypothetical protein ANO11243_071950 [fungal sp. No.11243]
MTIATKLLVLLSLTCSATAAAAAKKNHKPLAIIDVCPQKEGRWPNVTVTSQYQPVTYCVPTSTEMKNGHWKTHYPLKSTSVFVSTVIPCKYNGKTEQKCTVTTTDEEVLCRKTKTTVTTEVPVPAKTQKVSGSMITKSASTITKYKTIDYKYNAQYTHVGIMAIPGYQGCGICTECHWHNGVRTQGFNVTECHWRTRNAKTICTTYSEDGIWDLFR